MVSRSVGIGRELVNGRLAKGGVVRGRERGLLKRKRVAGGGATSIAATWG